MNRQEAARTKEVPGRLVVFMIGQTSMNLDAAADVEVETKTQKSAPSYPAVTPKQKIIKIERRVVDRRGAAFLVKSYPPDVVVVEASVEMEDILADDTLEFKRRLLGECRTILQEFSCSREFDEEYSVYCIAGYRGDPEIYLSLHGDRIAAYLKNETGTLDEEVVKATL
ncbi:MAG: hypothetical protein ACYC7L_01645 [Nitrospirota bacterium]